MKDIVPHHSTLIHLYFFFQLAVFVRNVVAWQSRDVACMNWWQPRVRQSMSPVSIQFWLHSTRKTSIGCECPGCSNCNMDALAASELLKQWDTKPQMVSVEGVRAFLESHGVATGADFDEYIAQENAAAEQNGWFHMKQGEEYIRRMSTVQRWKDLPWPSMCQGCNEIMPKQCFHVTHTFPKNCRRCVNAAKVSDTPQLAVDNTLPSDIQDGLEACNLQVPTKPNIVKMDGLRALGNDTDKIRRSDIIRWHQEDWVTLRLARQLFGHGAHLPQLCTSEGCTSINRDGVIKLQSSFANTAEMTGACKDCTKTRDSAARSVAAANRSSMRTVKCVCCEKDKPETAFEAGRKTCTSCRNKQASKRADTMHAATSVTDKPNHKRQRENDTEDTASQAAICTEVRMPKDHAKFWKSLERWGKGNTVFVRAAALHPFVPICELDSFIREHQSNKHVVKHHPKTGCTFVNMGSVRKLFKTLPWPRTCIKCKIERPCQAFPGTSAHCKECGGSSVAARSARAGISVREFRHRDAERKQK